MQRPLRARADPQQKLPDAHQHPHDPFVDVYEPLPDSLHWEEMLGGSPVKLISCCNACSMHGLDVDKWNGMERMAPCDGSGISLTSPSRLPVAKLGEQEHKDHTISRDGMTDAKSYP